MGVIKIDITVSLLLISFNGLSFDVLRIGLSYFILNTGGVVVLLTTGKRILAESATDVPSIYYRNQRRQLNFYLLEL